jgi:hypothetical protein
MASLGQLQKCQNFQGTFVVQHAANSSKQRLTTEGAPFSFLNQAVAGIAAEGVSGETLEEVHPL